MLEPWPSTRACVKGSYIYYTRALVALNRSAQESGRIIGDLLSDARSKVQDCKPATQARALAVRFTPTVACWDEASGADGLFLDVGGCAHLLAAK